MDTTQNYHFLYVVAPHLITYFLPTCFVSKGSVEKFCEKVEEEVDRLDILVNNAGLMMPKHLGTKQGFEVRADEE